jgi:hypothetical protein
MSIKQLFSKQNTRLLLIFLVSGISYALVFTLFDMGGEREFSFVRFIIRAVGFGLITVAVNKFSMGFSRKKTTS